MRRVALGIDAGNSTGLGLWEVGGGYLRCELVRIDRAGWSEQQAIELLDRFVGDARWVAAIERPWASGRGGHGTGASAKAFTVPPTFAIKHWTRVVDLFARARADRIHQAYRKPTVLAPRPEEWRRPLGVACRGVGDDARERRDYVKADAVRRLRVVHGLEIEQTDVAEAVSIAEWCARCVLRHEVIPLRGRAPAKVRFAA